jgi:riboflavin-specific deaminase-like protein
MRNIRSSVDAVLVGAGTLRSEDLTLTVDEPLTKRRRERGLKEQPLSVVLTESGDVPADRKIFQANEGDLLVFAGAHASQDNLVKLSKLASVRTATDTVIPKPKKILKTLADEFGVGRLLVEGGPSVNRSFLEAWLVDEVFLTLAPKIVGGDSRSLVDGEPLPQGTILPSLVSAYLSDSELYLRYLLTRWSGPGSSTSFR